MAEEKFHDVYVFDVPRRGYAFGVSPTFDFTIRVPYRTIARTLESPRLETFWTGDKIVASLEEIDGTWDVSNVQCHERGDLKVERLEDLFKFSLVEVWEIYNNKKEKDKSFLLARNENGENVRIPRRRFLRMKEFDRVRIKKDIRCVLSKTTKRNQERFRDKYDVAFAYLVI